jgi:hypothetical protein
MNMPVRELEALGFVTYLNLGLHPRLYSVAASRLKRERVTGTAPTLAARDLIAGQKLYLYIRQSKIVQFILNERQIENMLRQSTTGVTLESACTTIGKMKKIAHILL